MPTAEESRNAHLYSDVNQGPNSQHHRLGKGPNDSAPGNHKHNVSDISGLVIPQPPPVALSYDAASLPAATTIQNPTANVWYDIMSTADLAVGKWLIHMGAYINPAGINFYDMAAFVGSGVMTLIGQRSAGGKSSSATYPFHLSLGFIADVTQVGKITFRFRGTGTTTNTTYVVRGQTYGATSLEPNATGYTAVKIA